MPQNFLLLSGTILCMLFMTELLVRYFLPEFIPEHVFYNHYLLEKNADVRVDGVALVESNTFHHASPSGEFDVIYNYNRHGLRDKNDIAFADPAGLLAVGDSYTFGHGIREEERFSSLVADCSGMSVFNASVPTDLDGYEKLIDYANSIKETPFARLLIGVTMENDIFRERETIPESVPVLYELKRFLISHSALYIFMRFTIAANPLTTRLVDPTEQNEGFDSVEVQASVDKVASLAARASTTVLIIPSRFLWSANSSERRNADKVHEQFVHSLKQKSIDIVDMRGYYERDSSPQQYYFHVDGHWNTAGHALAADVLCEYLLAKY